MPPASHHVPRHVCLRKKRRSLDGERSVMQSMCIKGIFSVKVEERNTSACRARFWNQVRIRKHFSAQQIVMGVCVCVVISCF